MRCLDCERPMRPRPGDRTPKEPGVLYHQGRGLCSRCRKRHQRHGTLHQFPLTHPEASHPERRFQDLDADRRALDAWLWERRARMTHRLAA